MDDRDFVIRKHLFVLVPHVAAQIKLSWGRQTQQRRKIRATDRGLRATWGTRTNSCLRMTKSRSSICSLQSYSDRWIVDCGAPTN